jgi:hypothetical protein
MTPRPLGRQLGGGGSSQNDVFGAPMMVTRQTGTGRAYRECARLRNSGLITFREARFGGLQIQIADCLLTSAEPVLKL